MGLSWREISLDLDAIFGWRRLAKKSLLEISDRQIIQKGTYMCNFVSSTVSVAGLVTGGKVGTRRKNNVIILSKRRCDVVLT